MAQRYVPLSELKPPPTSIGIYENEGGSPPPGWIEPPQDEREAAAKRSLWPWRRWRARRRAGR